jgi:hypothetical protein
MILRIKSKYGQDMVTAITEGKIKAPDHEGQGLKSVDAMRFLTFRELRCTTSSLEAVFLTFLNNVFRLVPISAYNR